MLLIFFVSVVSRFQRAYSLCLRIENAMFLWADFYEILNQPTTELD